MKVMALRFPAGLDRLVFENRIDPGEPCPAEIRVALHGSSPNFHNLDVATGRMPARTGGCRSRTARAWWRRSAPR